MGPDRGAQRRELEAPAGNAPILSRTPTIPSPPSARHSATARDSASLRAVYIVVINGANDGLHAEDAAFVPSAGDHAPGQPQTPEYPMLKTAVPST